MKKILGYLVDYVRSTDKRILGISMLFMAAFVAVNYNFGLNNAIYTLPRAGQYTAWYGVFLAAFLFPYFCYAIASNGAYLNQKPFLFLLAVAPLIFSWKMVAHPYFGLSGSASENEYWNQIVYWPFKLLVVSMAIAVIARVMDGKAQPYGLVVKGFDPKPYLLMLVLMIPLIAAASMQDDFLRMYPRMQNMSFLAGPGASAGLKVLYELAYGTDFITIELFFRGFLVLAFLKWAGKDAILPMACFYCTIHFGKPLGECISSFFGGLILGVVIFHTRTILGGLMVHLGIAWLMELGGALGHVWKYHLP